MPVCLACFVFFFTTKDNSLELHELGAEVLYHFNVLGDYTLRKMQRFDSIDTSIFTSNLAIGGGGGKQFYYNVDPKMGIKSEVIVRSLKFWYNNQQGVNAVRVELTNGKDATHGKMEDDETDLFYIADGEKITSLKLRRNDHAGGHLGALELTTNQNRKCSFGHQSGCLYEPEIGSGLMVGVFGKSGWDIDCLGFALLRRAKAKIINMKYPVDIPIQTAPKSYKTIRYDNSEGAVDQTFTFAGKESVMTSSSWSVTAGMEIGVETEVEAGVPLIASAKTTVSAKVSLSATHSLENSKTTEESFSFPVTVPAGEILQATAVLYEGKINTTYEADMVYTVDTGKQFQYHIKGSYNGIDSDKVVVVLDKIDQQ